MSMVSFMPWCRIEKAYDVGEIKILSFQRHENIEGLDEVTQCRVNTILATYKTIEGKPIDRAALVQYGGKSLIDDLSEEERETIHELVALACFCGIARCEYFNSLGHYCNSDCFAIYIQKFDRADFTALTTRRREGQTLSGWPIDDIAITVPVHCQTVREVSIDEALLKALTSHRMHSKDEAWARWQNAISCFNQANTDGENVRYQVEWVLLCSAFEHLLEAASDYKDVAKKFVDAFMPSTHIPVKAAKRKAQSWTDLNAPLRYEWMKEFYRIRGDFAHGKLNSHQPAVWNTLEHLVLGAIAFPLLVRCLLEKAGRYALTDSDTAQINAFERLMDEPFLESPPDEQGSGDSYWSRLLSEARWDAAHDKAIKDLEAKGWFQTESDHGS